MRPYFSTGQGAILWHLRVDFLELTLEVMSSFELDMIIISLSNHDTINFQIFEVEYLMSYMEFSVVMGLVTIEYTRTKSYSQLYVNMPVHLSSMSTCRETYVYGTTKVSAMERTAFKYLHVVLSQTLTGREDSMGVVNLRDFYFLWTMVAQDPRLAIIFPGPYITRFARGLGLIDRCLVIQRVRGMQPLESLRYWPFTGLSGGIHPTGAIPGGPLYRL